MSQPLYVHAFAVLHRSGINSAGSGHRRWDANQQGPLEVRRSQVFSQPLPTFGKLLPVERLAFGVSALIFADVNWSAGESTGISLGSRFGSYGADMRFMESVVEGTPRPAFFSATLPSAPVAEAAIQFGLKGPNRVVCGGECAGLQALETAMRVIRAGKAAAMLVLEIDGLEQMDRQSPPIATHPSVAACACGVLIATSRPVHAPAWRIALKGDFRQDNRSPAAAESYFSEALMGLTGGESVCRPISSPDFQGTISMEKEA
jgi:hypothetical protein